MFVKYLREYKAEPTGLPDEIPWQSVVDVEHGILATEDDGMFCTFYIEPFDFGSFTKVLQGIIKLRINESSKWLPGGWAVWLHAKRVPVVTYPSATWMDPVAALLDDEQRMRLTAPGVRWDTEVYLTLWHRPEPVWHSLLHRVFFTDVAEQPVVDQPRHLEAFQSSVARCMTMLSSACERVTCLDMEKLLRYLKPMVSIYEHDVAVPDASRNVGAYLSDSGFHTGIRPILGPVDQYGNPIDGGVYLRSLTMSDQFPPKLRIGMLRDWNRLNFPSDYICRWIPMGQELAQKTTTKRQINYLSSKKSWRAMLHETLTKQPTDDLDRHVQKKADDADIARDEMLSNKHALGHLSMVWLVRHPELAEANRRIQAIQHFLHAHGCIPLDDPLTQVENYLSTLPGNIRQNVEKHQVTTLNWADIGPWQKPWGGVQYNAHLKGPALCQAITEGCMPFGVDTFVGDVGHAKMIGPMGSGKSTALGWFGMQWLRYADAQLFPWDVGGSSRCMTACLNGGYHDLGKGNLGIQLLADVDDDRELQWIINWLLNRLQENEVALTPEARSFVSSNLRALREQPALPRRMESLIALCADHIRHWEQMYTSQRDEKIGALIPMGRAVRTVLREYAQGGIYGNYVDAPRDTFALQRIHTFELESLLKLPRVFPGVFELVQHRVEARCDGRPTRQHFDEAWVCFWNAILCEDLRTRIPGHRRNNISDIFATQSISQMTGNPLTPLLKESCQTSFWLPNPSAMHGDILPLYEDMDLNAEEVEHNIAMVPPKGFMYITRPDGKRLIDMTLAPMAKSICGANTKEDHRAMDEILDKYDAHEFAYHWLMRQGYPEGAKRVQRALDKDCVADAATFVFAGDH